MQMLLFVSIHLTILTLINRPHDRVPLKEMKVDWHSCLDNKIGFKGFANQKRQPAELNHGSVVTAAITSCTNTSNPSVMLGAGLVVKKACELGLQKYLNEQGFCIVGYGCTTCIGNSGDLDESVASAISENDIVAAAVLSGNQNFEGHAHPLTRANYVASHSLVVAYALAGTVDIDLEKQPIGVGKDGKNVYFKDIWPSTEEVIKVVQSSVLPNMFKSTYESITKGNPLWNDLPIPASKLYSWEPNSTYIHEPPYFKNMTMDPLGPSRVNDAYYLRNFGDSIAMDHISPARSINKDSLAAKYLLEHGVECNDFNSYVGQKTLYVFDAVARYKAAGQDTTVLAGAESGNESSRDWAAKGPMLLVSIVIWALELVRTSPSILDCIVLSSAPFSNYWNVTGIIWLMCIVPLCFMPGEHADSLGLTGHERYTIDLPSKINKIRPGEDVTVGTDSGKSFTFTVLFDTEPNLSQEEFDFL
ncbi:hypothetical protein ACSBR2_014934 [Camellia fascicularis]